VNIPFLLLCSAVFAIFDVLVMKEMVGMREPTVMTLGIGKQLMYKELSIEIQTKDAHVFDATVYHI
jgi:hypothetical protein